MKNRDQILIQNILTWYKKNKRDLPWRKTRDPYRILVSETMLQQTQVERVIPKYLSFLDQFPTAEALAEAKTRDVIVAWQGLGYNRRALYLQKTAQSIVQNYGGVFPVTVEELKKFPGIGEYTARAVLSFAFHKKVAVMDTNHRKFYERVFGRRGGDRVLLAKADLFLADLTAPQVYAWNQAIMDFISALLRGESDGTILWFQKTYPEKKKKGIVKKKAVPFRESDRYIRGRIIDTLRSQKRLSASQLFASFPDWDPKRLRAIAHKLQKDGLIAIKNHSMILP